MKSAVYIKSRNAGPQSIYRNLFELFSKTHGAVSGTGG
jgi:hypothetical protein